MGVCWAGRLLQKPMGLLDVDTWSSYLSKVVPPLPFVLHITPLLSPARVVPLLAPLLSILKLPLPSLYILIPPLSLLRSPLPFACPLPLPLFYSNPFYSHAHCPSPLYACAHPSHPSCLQSPLQCTCTLPHPTVHYSRPSPAHTPPHLF